MSPSVPVITVNLSTVQSVLYHKAVTIERKDNLFDTAWPWYCLDSGENWVRWFFFSLKVKNRFFLNVELKPASLLKRHAKKKLKVNLCQGFPDDSSGKEPASPWGRHRRCGFDPWVGKIPWRSEWQPTPVFLPGESHHGQRSLVG